MGGSINKRAVIARQNKISHGDRLLLQSQEQRGPIIPKNSKKRTVSRRPASGRHNGINNIFLVMENRRNSGNVRSLTARNEIYVQYL